MEHLYIQEKYLSFCSSQLERFKRRDQTLWNFRCPFCGDSHLDSKKARGYLYRNKKGLISFQCHNCGENCSFKNFLKHVNPRLHSEYVLESFRQTSDEKELPVHNVPEKTEVPEWINDMVQISSLSRLHPVVEFCKRRKIPVGGLYYTPNFRKSIEPLNLGIVVPDDPRLVIPELDRFGNLQLLIARAIKSSDLRYVTLKVNEAAPKLYGLSKLNFSDDVFVVEGAIDSLFLPNCVASLDANLTHFEHDETGIHDPVLIWDNEPRSKNTCRFMDQAIRKGYRVVIWPDSVTAKDINDMVLAGIEVQDIIRKHTYRGVTATLKFNSWKRINDPQRANQSYRNRL